MIKVVGFCGKAKAGKTTAAELLAWEMPFAKVRSFAAPLKDCLERLFKFTQAQLYTSEGKDTIDPRYGVTPRLILQRFGTEFVRTTVPKLWLLLMEEELRDLDASWVFVDDVRFEDEAQLIRDHGGILIEIQRGDGIVGGHASERGIDKPDYIIVNSGNFDALKQQVLTTVLSHSLVCSSVHE